MCHSQDLFELKKNRIDSFETLKMFQLVCSSFLNNARWEMLKKKVCYKANRKWTEIELFTKVFSVFSGICCFILAYYHPTVGCLDMFSFYFILFLRHVCFVSIAFQSSVNHILLPFVKDIKDFHNFWKRKVSFRKHSVEFMMNVFFRFSILSCKLAS